MKIELVQNEDLTVKTKTGSTVTVPSPSADDTLATISDLEEAIQFKEWFPGGEAKSIADCTSGLKFDWAHADSTNRTVSVLPFCNTGNSANDNSDKTGVVIIPPHVDHDGSTYTVVGVAEGHADPDNSGLTGIVAPTTVTTVANGAFSGCTHLASISLPAVTAIGKYVFSGCHSLASVFLPAATAICDYTFSGCYSLTSVSLPAATTIDGYAFYYCHALDHVDFGPAARQSVPTLGGAAFPDISQIGRTCRIVVPDSQFAAWTADADWAALTPMGYEFVKWSLTQPATREEAVRPDQRNLLDYTTNTTLAADTAVYRFSADMSGTSASIPSLTYTGIPTSLSYYCFELEVYVPDTATSLTGPTTSSNPPWIWIPGGELPTYGYAGKTVFIACRMDCASRKVMANCYLVGDSIKVDPVGMETLALASGVIPTDSTTMGDIQTALGLSDTATVQDAIDAAS